MKLIGADASPFVQRVKIVAQIKGIDLPLGALPEGGLKGSQFRHMNPMARMPVLLADDGWALAESATIAMFLDETSEGPSVLPVEARARARVRWFVQLVDGPLDAGVRAIVRTRVMVGSDAPLIQQDSADIAELGIEEANEALAAIDALAGQSGRWLVGDKPTLADASVFPMLVMLDVLRPWNKVDDRINIPVSLERYRDHLMLDPIFGGAASRLRASFADIARAWGVVAR